jgi:hypothetical protein
MLLPKLEKQREFDPFIVGLFQFQTPIRRTLEKLEKHKRRVFSINGRTNIWDFVGLNFSLAKFYGQSPY